MYDSGIILAMDRRGAKNRCIALTVVWAVHLGLWFLFVARFSMQELFIGVAAAAVATAAAAIFQAVEVVRFRPAARFFAEAWRLPGAMLSDTVLLFRALALELIARRGAPSQGECM